MFTDNKSLHIVRKTSKFGIASKRMWANDVTLSGGDNYTAQDGDVLTGSTDGTVTIAAQEYAQRVSDFVNERVVPED